MQGLSHGDRGDGVFEDQLLLVVGVEHDGILVEGADAARELDSAQQVNGDVGSLLACRIEEGVLDVLRRLIFHRRSP
jgi:hypothetical protein